MLTNALLVAHIAVLGYWLGSDLCINSTFRYVSRAASMPFAERDRLMDHVLDIDQHVRYALVLQVGLGTALAAELGYLPGGAALAVAAGILAVAWLLLVEATHRLRKTPGGRTLAAIDRGVRHVAIGLALVLAAGGLAGHFRFGTWLSLKFCLFAAVIVCGLGIRLALARYFRVWHEIGAAGSTAAREARLRVLYRQATAVLVMLWVCIAGITVLSVFKPF